MKFRLRTTGGLHSQREIKEMNPNSSLPLVWTSEVYDELGIDPVLASPKPTAGTYQTVSLDGTVKDSLDNWVENWVLVDMFSDITRDGVNVTKADLETEHLVKLKAKALVNLRSQRDELLRATDKYALSDRTLSTGMTTYRQDLRELPTTTTDVFNVIFPTKPSELT